MLNFWQDAEQFWTDVPSWFSDDDATMAAIESALTLQEHTVGTGDIAAPDTSSVAFSVQDVSIEIIVAVEVETIPMTAFVKDFEQYIVSTVDADLVALTGVAEEVTAGYIVPNDVPMVPAYMVPRDPYIFSDVLLDVSTIELTAAVHVEDEDSMFGVLTPVDVDVIPMSAAVEFYYFEITSLLAVDYLSAAFTVPDADVFGNVTLEAEALALATAMYDGTAYSPCVVEPDILVLAANLQSTDLELNSTVLADALGIATTLYIAPPLSNMTVEAELLALAADLKEALPSVDITAEPGVMSLSVSEPYEPEIMWSCAWDADGLPLSVAAQEGETSVDIEFVADEITMAAAVGSLEYAGRRAFEAIMLDTPVTTQVILSTPVSIVQRYEEIGNG